MQLGSVRDYEKTLEMFSFWQQEAEGQRVRGWLVQIPDRAGMRCINKVSNPQTK